MVMHYDFNIRTKISAIYQKSWTFFMEFKNFCCEESLDAGHTKSALLFLPPDILEIVQKHVWRVDESELKFSKASPVVWMAPSIDFHFLQKFQNKGEV